MKFEVGAKLGDGPLEDDGNARLLALPKKMLPKSKRDRFLLFVEKSKSSITNLREQFASNDYSTKTQGTSHTPAAAPFAEGVYVITSTGRESHLAYQITYPEIGEIQKEVSAFLLTIELYSKPGLVCTVVLIINSSLGYMKKAALYYQSKIRILHLQATRVWITQPNIQTIFKRNSGI